MPDSAPRPSADRNLLFGILALQMDFITRDALIEAMHAWVLDKAKSLEQILLEQGTLRQDAHALLAALVDKHLALHDNDAEKSLAALSSAGSVREQLARLADPDLDASLAHVSAARQDETVDDVPRAPATMEGLSSAGLRFRILRPHARGGLGEVYVALDNNLGAALYAKNDLEGAISAYRKAIQLDPQDFKAYYNLGSALFDKKDVEGAIKAFRTAIQLNPKYPNAYGGLGFALLHKGQFGEARQATLQALKLAPTNHPWRGLAKRHLQQCDKLLALDRKLTAFLDGGDPPAGVENRLALADLCRRYKHYHATAVRLYDKLFAVRPTLADDLAKGLRYQAACSALLAAAGKGLDAKPSDGAEKTKLRIQALEWLRGDLDSFAKQFRAGKAADIALLLERLPVWEKDDALVPVRNPQALNALPSAEQEAWSKLWSDRDQLLQQVRAAVTETCLEGTLTAQERSQAHERSLTAGTTYVIDLHSTAFDAYLKLLDANGKVLAEHDDIAPDNQDARLIFMPKEDGTFRIVATSFEQRGTGPYTLTIRAIGGKRK
jgi:tetratricopeptide (TPR) repeat protein